MNIGSLVRRAAHQFGDRTALMGAGTRLTFAQFDEHTDSLAVALLARGLRPGDRVAVLLPNGIDLPIVYYALAKAGLVRVALNYKDRDHDNQYKVADSGARGLIGGTRELSDVDVWLAGDEARALAGAGLGQVDLAPYRGEEIYRFGYTGGTTGRPKGVVLTQANERALLRNYLMDLMPEIGPDDVMVHVAPMSHASGSFFLPHLLRGAANVVLDGFDPSTFLTSAREYRATAAFLVPTMIALLVDQTGSDPLPGLRRLYYSASPIAPSIVEKAQAAFGPVLCQTYGQSESPMCITYLAPDDHHRVGSAGKPYTFCEVRVRDENGDDLAAGSAGEVVVRSDLVMAGYWNKPEATDATLRDGWLHTGDYGEFGTDGYLYLLDRMDDTIISGGFNVYPREIEDVLLDHPSVMDCAVVGRRDDRWGEVVHAVVVARGEVSGDEVLTFARRRLAGYKRPRSVEVWPDLPKSAAGKTLRREIRDAINGRAAAG